MNQATNQTVATPAIKGKTKKVHPMAGRKFSSFVGTAKDFELAGIELNGLPVNSVALSVLAKFDVVTEVGKTDKPKEQRGKPSTIYKLQGRPGLNVTIPEVAPAQAPKAEPTTVAEVAKPAPTKLQKITQGLRELLQNLETTA